MSNILLIEDDADINQVVCEYLSENEYRVTQAFSGTEGKLLWQMQEKSEDKFDLIIMDLMMPGICGEELLTIIRRTSQIPVIIISAKNALPDKVNLLSDGADDYLTKPFELEELLVRMQVQLRRRGTDTPDTRALEYERWRIDKEAHILLVDNVPIPLTVHEFSIIELLMRRPKKVFTKQEIYESIWEQAYAIEDKTINVHISNIRNKLKDTGTSDYIQTVWGIGFRMKEH